MLPLGNPISIRNHRCPRPLTRDLTATPRSARVGRLLLRWLKVAGREALLTLQAISAQTLRLAGFGRGAWQSTAVERDLRHARVQLGRKMADSNQFLEQHFGRRLPSRTATTHDFHKNHHVGEEVRSRGCKSSPFHLGATARLTAGVHVPVLRGTLDQQPLRARGTTADVITDRVQASTPDCDSRRADVFVC